MDNEEEFLGYVYFPDGMHTEPVHLKGMQAVKSYVALQVPLQYRVTICDSEDCIIFESLNGDVAFPYNNRTDASAVFIGGNK